MNMAEAISIAASKERAKPVLTPREQSVYNVLASAQGRYIRSDVIRDRVMPGLHIRNVRKTVWLMRRKGLRIEASGNGNHSKGFRLVEAA
ncbi:hypothetical protein [Sphingobium bisphenolivorans]|uniref:hypothetical protein n=1 Tax=Sphingobium bisphenolivorans TaxID=1335760 RepID=UPI0003A2D2FD|nr:hypothetical protein [Sphingobium bisphenolivorans]